jgi:DNA-binding IclR family transcriptional regulator
VISLLGQALPLHCTAAGKIHLAFESSDDPTRNLPDQLERYTDKTIVDREALLRQLKDVGEHGYAVDQGEFMAEVSSVAVPIHDYTRNLVGSLAIAGPAHRLTRQRIEQEIVPLITDGGNQLSNRLGHQR